MSSIFKQGIAFVTFKIKVDRTTFILQNGDIGSNKESTEISLQILWGMSALSGAHPPYRRLAMLQLIYGIFSS